MKKWEDSDNYQWFHTFEPGYRFGMLADKERTQPSERSLLYKLGLNRPVEEAYQPQNSYSRLKRLSIEYDS